MTVSQNIGLPVFGYTHGAPGDFMTSLAPADLHGKSLSNDTFFHFTLMPSFCRPRSPSTVLAWRRPHLPQVVHCLTPLSRPDFPMIVPVHTYHSKYPRANCLPPMPAHVSINSAGRRLHILELRHIPNLYADEVHSILLAPPPSPWPSHDTAAFALLLWGTVLLANLDTLQQGLCQSRGG